MKRPLFIILGLVAILLLLGVWVYVLLTGSPDNQEERFGTFNFGDTTDPSVQIEPEVEPETPIVNVGSRNKLRQLTTEPVIGYTEIPETASTTAKVYYVSAGTGHIFSIDLETGEEKRISGTTIPLARAAALTPDGGHVFMQAGDGTNAEIIIGTIATSSEDLSNFKLPESNQVLSFTATHNNEFLYITPDGNNAIAKAYNPENNSTRTLFTVPFRDVTVQWHHTAGGPHIVYPKATNRLEGFAYSYTNGVRSRLPLTGFGLSAVGSDEYVISSKTGASQTYTTNTYSYVTNRTSDNVPLTIVPEKCAFSSIITDSVWCAVTLADYNNSSDMPDSWYRGERGMQDGLWDIRLFNNSSTFLSDLSAESGTDFDLINPQFNTESTALYFQNKTNQTLWTYDLRF